MHVILIAFLLIPFSINWKWKLWNHYTSKVLIYPPYLSINFAKLIYLNAFKIPKKRCSYRNHMFQNKIHAPLPHDYFFKSKAAVLHKGHHTFWHNLAGTGLAYLTHWVHDHWISKSATRYGYHNYINITISALKLEGRKKNGSTIRFQKKTSLFEREVFCWPTRTRTLNDWTKISCVTNYTIGQYQKAILDSAFERANL